MWPWIIWAFGERKVDEEMPTFHAPMNLYFSANWIRRQARLRRIVTCIGPNQKNQPNLDLYLVRRSKIFVSVATLIRQLQGEGKDVILTDADCHIFR